MTRQSIRDKVLNELAQLEQAATTVADAPLPDFDQLIDAAVDHRLEPNTRIGHWTIRDQIGQGGMARVYRVERDDGLLDQQLALKIMSDRFDSDSARTRFMREQQILANLHHQHIARFLDAGVTEDGQPWFVMEYIDGPNLLAYCQSESLSLNGRIRLFRQVGEALAHAHAHGIVHRDIKPSNILVDTTQRQVRLLDFGVASEQTAEALTLTGTVMGTPGYMSPEQATGSTQIDERSDLFAMGILLYQLANDRLPFPGDSLPQLSYQVVHQSPEACDASVPADLAAIIAQCLEKKPEHRYASVNLLLDDIDAFLKGQPVQARRIGRLHRLLRWTQRNPAISTAAAVALLALIGAAVFTSWQSYRALQSIQASETAAYRSQKLVNEVRRIHMMPAHDVQPDYARVREQLTELQQSLIDNPLINPGQGHAAVGAVYLALAEPDQARLALETSRAHGWHTAQATYDYGRAMLSLWEIEQQKLRQIRDEQARNAHETQLQQQYRDPAIAALRSVQGSIDQSTFLEARLALIDGDFDRAIERAEQSLARDDWHYESHLLIAQTLMTRLRTEGTRTGYRDSLPDIERSMQHNQAALKIGRSDPMVHTNVCADYSAQVQYLRLMRRDQELTEASAEGVTACQTALELAPESESAHRNMAEILIAQGDHLGFDQPEAESLFQQALEAVRTGRVIEPENIRMRLLEVKALVRLAVYRRNHDLPGVMTLYQQAHRIAEGVAEEDPLNHLSWAELARVTLSMANHQRDNAQSYAESEPLYRDAISHYAHAQSLSGSFAAALNQAFTWSELAENHALQGQTDEALEAADQSIELFVQQLDPQTPSHRRYWVSALGISLTAMDLGQQAGLAVERFSDHTAQIGELICTPLLAADLRDEAFDELISQQRDLGQADRLARGPCMAVYLEHDRDG